MEKRRYVRSNLRMSAAFRERGKGSFPATLINVTPDGGCIETTAETIEGVEGWLQLPTLSNWLSSIKWRQDSRYGLSFATPFHATVVTMILNRAHGVVPASVGGSTAEVRDIRMTGASRAEQILGGLAVPLYSPVVTQKKPLLGDSAGGWKSLVSRQVSRTSNHRREERYPDVVNEAALHIRGEHSAVAVLNISETGTMVQSPMRPKIGEMVAIEFAGFDQIPGTVAWLKDGRFGVDFGSPSVDLFDLN